MAGINQLGKGMMVVGSLTFLGVLTLWFGDIEQDRHYPNRNLKSIEQAGMTTVTLRQDRQGHYTFTGRINGQPVDFLVDTGATDVVIPQNVAVRLGLQPGRPQRANTAAGTITVYQTVIPTLEIAGLRFDNVSGVVNPGMEGGAALLGMSVIRHLDLEQTGRTLILREKNDG